MTYALRLTAAATLAAATALLPTPATAAPDVDGCLAARPGAVTADAVTPGDDVVCLPSGTERVPSEGDDTYLWVGDEAGELRPATNPDTAQPWYDDPGVDTLSLELWDGAWTDGDRMFGVRVHFPVDGLRLTEHADTFGRADVCDRLTSNTGFLIDAGAGDDLVQCVTGQITTGEGSDTVVGVTLGTTVDTGAGGDHVIGDGDADSISLGSGDDTADVVAGAVDEVYGGTGTDVVQASRNDLLFSARMVAAPAPAPQPVVRPAASGSLRCVNGRETTLGTARLNNSRSNVSVAYTVVKRLPSGKVTREQVRVPAGEVKARSVRVRGDRQVARLTVRAAGDTLLSLRVPGRRC